MKRALLTVLEIGLLLPACASIPIHAFIVCDADGSPAVATETVRDHISNLNLVFSQVVMDFELVRLAMITNESWLSVSSSNPAQHQALCATAQGTGGIELYYVEEIDDCVAFKTPSGLVVSRDANGLSVAHEVGHLCGLTDIYDDHEGTTLRVTGRSSRNRMPNDYGRPDFSIPHAKRLEKLLMYGYQNSSKLAITSGDIYGLGRSIRRNDESGNYELVWDLYNVEVGFWEHGTRTPSCD